MAKSIPFSGAAQAAHARKTKNRFLPIPRATTDQLALQAHLALDTLRRGQGGITDARTLLETLILTGLLVDRGYGQLDLPAYSEANAIVEACFERGRTTNAWLLEADGVSALAEIVTLYDEQLGRAPLTMLVEVSDQLDRFKAGHKLSPPRKSA